MYWYMAEMGMLENPKESGEQTTRGTVKGNRENGTKGNKEITTSRVVQFDA